MIGNSWDNILKAEFEKPYFQGLQQKVNLEYETQTVFPPKDDIYNALKYTDFNDVKVVIIGQDPYHGDFQAHGLSFSVKKGVKLPPSLKNIYKEISDEFNIEMPNDYGCLTYWAEQGVLMINSVLTVRKAEPNSHKSLGWEKFTDSIISSLNQKQTPVVYLLWGANAIKKSKLITNENHLILTAAHPSPLSVYRGFYGCDHFKKANEYLMLNNLKEIDWKIEKL